MSPEDSDQVARCGRDGSPARNVPHFFDRTNRNNDPVSFGLHGIRMWLVEIENQTRDKRTGGVLARTHTPYPIFVDSNILDAVVAGGIRKIEQDSFWIRCRLKRRLYRITERHFYAQIGAVVYRRHTLHRRRPAGALCHGTRQQEHDSPEMFLNCRHC
jgi:hypothetical protein